MSFFVDVPKGTLAEAYSKFKSNKLNNIADGGYAYALINYRNMENNIKAGREGKCYCQKCGDTKFLPHITLEADRYYFGVEICKCINADVVKQSFLSSGLANEAENKTFATYIADNEFTQTIKNRAKDYLDYIKANKTPWFYIGGQTGAGKSHICIAIANRFIQNNYKLIYMRWVDVIRQIKSDLGNNDYIKKVKEIQVLYIDDMFKGSVSEYDITLAFEIINFRDSNGLITIISSEMLPEALQRIDSALYYRILANTGEKFMISISPDINKNYRIKCS